MTVELIVSPQGHLSARTPTADQVRPDEQAKRILSAFAESPAHGLLHLATAELQSSLPIALAFARDLGRAYLTRLSHTPGLEGAKQIEPVEPPISELAMMAMRAPPMVGAEYLTADVLADWWSNLDHIVRKEIASHLDGAQAYLQKKNPIWRLVGRVTFHLAENKRDPQMPFAFMATYATRLSAQGRVQHEPLGKALEQYSGTKNRAALISLLTPIQRAAEKSKLAKEIVDSGDVYHPLAWTTHDAYRFLQEIPIFEESGLIVRVPDWWKDRRPSRPSVNVKVGSRGGATIGVDSLLEFSAGLALDGESLSESEMQTLLDAESGLVLLKGKWVEVDRKKLQEALAHWKKVEQETRESGMSFFEGMRLISGVAIDKDAAAALPQEARQWMGISLDDSLERALAELRDPAASHSAGPPGLLAELRPYQQAGVHWLRMVTRLGLGACLADDMGLGKTVQVIGLLLHRKRERRTTKSEDVQSLIVVPASLIANWKAEVSRFAPELTMFVAHPSEMPANGDGGAKASVGIDLVVTTYSMLSRLEWLKKRSWDLVILDEAQAIKNSGTRQTRAVKELQASSRIALTGTPVENRLADLWSLFDFLNPGLLGGASTFGKLTKRLDKEGGNAYGPLRTLVKPYLLRRLKTDKRVIADLPEKTEVAAYCPLSKRQVALYEHSVRELAAKLEDSSGIQRRGLVLSHLMRLKQICNHPSHAMGDGTFEPKDSGKFQRLAALCEELAERQEKALVFTQFREITEPLAGFLGGVFGQSGLVLHGGTSVAKRRELVDAFQKEDGPPFFVLSLKAGGTGLNLTAASHVIHFDRWWNPAVENQATDRAFRIGQKRNVLVHKFVCRGTVEEKIDEMLSAKSAIAQDILDGGGEVLLTEMDNEQLLKVLALDVDKALES